MGLTLTDAAAAVRSGALASVDLVDHALTVTHQCDGAVGSFVRQFVDEAMEAARATDDAVAAGHQIGPLGGIPIAVKDVISTAEAPSTAQSHVLPDGWSAGDAVSVARLRSAGAIVIGKTTTMEFALGPPDVGQTFPLPRNPWSLGYWAGGSSSGSASSVAMGTVLGALGTDTGGSIRIPAAFCGVTGMAPTFGTVPTQGVIPVAETMDRVGPIARTARDCALLLSVLTDAGDRDGSSSVGMSLPVGQESDLRGLRIGVDRHVGVAEADDPLLAVRFDEAVAVLEASGATTVDVSVPRYRQITSAALVTMLSESVVHHLPLLRTRWSDYYPPTRTILASGLFLTAPDYVAAQQIRRIGNAEISALWRSVDVVITPTVRRTAIAVSDLATISRRTGRGPDGPILTSYWSALGCPALSVPMGFGVDDLPLGLQVAGPMGSDSVVLRVGDAFQRLTPWHDMAPQLATVLQLRTKS